MWIQRFFLICLLSICPGYFWFGIQESRIDGEEMDVSIKELKLGALPDGWSVELRPIQGRVVFVITTNEIETNGSIFGSADEHKEFERIEIRITLFPRYSDEMLAELKAYNQALPELFPNTKEDTRGNAELRGRIVKLPMFINDRYGFSIDYLPRVPVNENDGRQLVTAVESFSSDWIYVGTDRWAEKMNTSQVLTKMLTK